MRYLADAPNQAPAPPLKQTLSPELATLCTQAATRLETLGLSPKEAKRRLWDTIKEAVPGEPIGEADLARVTPEVIAAAEADVKRHRESNTRAASALAASEAEAAGTKRAHSACRSCGQPIRWQRTPGKSHTPVNLDGQPHWATCPQRDQWRRSR